jgi:molecular chaperone HtpG
LYPDWDFKEMEVQDLFDQLQHLEAEEKKEVEGFLQIAQEELLSLRCDVMIRKFEPQHIPTICYLEPGARLDRTSDLDTENLPDTWLSLQKKLSVMSVSSQATLCINYRNPTIQRLLNIQQGELLGLYIRYLYFQAILLGNYSLTKKELQMFSQGLMEMIDLHELKSKGNA